MAVSIKTSIKNTLFMVVLDLPANIVAGVLIAELLNIVKYANQRAKGYSEQ